MTFNFNDVGIFWINCSTNIKRAEHMKLILNKYFPYNKIYHVEAVMYSPKYHGVTMAHMVAILQGIASKRPFLILEDDVTVDVTKLDTKMLENEILKMEKKPEAVYLGLSTWGTNSNKQKELLKGRNESAMEFEGKILMSKGARCLDIGNRNLVRVDDMYGAHAILYLSNDYGKKTIQYCVHAIEVNRPHDVFLPKLLKNELVVGLRSPWFYQLASIGGQEKATKLNLNYLKIIEPKSFSK